MPTELEPAARQNQVSQPAGDGSLTFDFTDRVVIVTGATGGIGSAVADLFAASGAKLVLHGRRTEVLAERVESVAASGGEAVAVSGNIKLPETSEQIVSTALDRFGRIDALINNAGGNFGARLEDLSVNAWNATIGSNLSGPFHLAIACLPALRAAGGGAIVNVGSSSASYAHPLRGAYAAAKAGLASLTRTMAWEWAEDNIRVNCVEPGATMTPASRFALQEETAASVSKFIAMGRIGRPEDIARVCVFLCSAGASYLTGETIRVAGGPHTSTPADVDLIRGH